MFKPLAIFALLFACSPVGDPDVEVAPLSLTPSTEAWALAERSAGLWYEASGIEIPFSTNGIPVELQDQVFDRGEEICGGTTVTRGRESGKFFSIDLIAIAVKPSVGCRSNIGVMTHELGHVLCEYGIDEEAPNGCHLKERALMGSGNGSEEVTRPDELSLELVCSRANCSVFRPFPL